MDEDGPRPKRITTQRADSCHRQMETCSKRHEKGKLLLLVSLVLVLELAGAVGTDHPSNDTHPYNSGGLDVQLDFDRNDTYLVRLNNTERVCTVPYCTVKSSQCTSQEVYTCSPPEDECRSEFNTRIFCYGYNKGYIEKLHTIQKAGASCVTLEVPADHVAMISFSRANRGKLTMHKNAACEGEGEVKHLGVEQLIEPEVYDLRAISFRFILQRESSGMHHIIYSFHKTTAKLQKLRNGRWNCSGPYFSQFNDHFVCSPNDHCSDSRSVDRCRTDLSICGYSENLKSFSTGPGQCYYRFKHVPADSVLARMLCISFHGRLTSPNSPAFIEMLKSLTFGHGTFFVEKIQLFVPDMIRERLQMAWCDDNHMVHAFQACDATTGCLRTSTKADRSCADSKFSSPVPFFTCDTKLQDVPYSMVCDFREDCSDGSDEYFCLYRGCTDYEFTCRNKQCVGGRHHRCDRISDCYDGSDEDKNCGYFNSYKGLDNIEPPAIVDWTAPQWNSRPLDDLNFSCPTTHFHCHGYKVCLPVYLLCNGMNDCPDKQDETGCVHFRCPGFYRCRSSRICLHRDHLCDGVVQCPHHDDELMCDARPCPDACVCYGYAFTCTDEFEARWHRDLRYLDASGSGMILAAVSINNTLLIHLSLRHCGISSIGKVDLPNLQRLDLSHNLLNVIAAWELNQLGNLRYLSLAYNPASLRLAFLSDANHEFPVIRELSLAGLNIPLLNETFALTFPNIEELNLSDSSLTLLPKSGFRSFKRLRVLDIRKCQLQTVFSGLFEGLVELETIHADDFKICCPSVLPVGFNPKDCHAPIDVSSCDALLRSDAFRVFLVLYALFSLLGNLGSFVYRVFVDKSDVAMGFNVFVTHLSVSDFLMGVYLAIIGVADRIFYGDYVWRDTEWRHSTPCLIAGFLSFLSSEVSVFLVCFITLERLLVIRFPLKNLRFSRRTAHIICVALWIAGVTLSAVPLFPALKHWEFYSQSGICIPLPITGKTFPGMDYAFGVMICLNFVVFVFIAVGQGLIYVSFRSNTMTAQTSAKSKDVTIASRLLAVVLTDFLCWFPIGLLGILARSDVSIPGEVNVGMAIFVLPFNSALNPILYTVIVALERRRKTRGRCLANAKKKARLSKPQVLENIDSWLTEQVISLHDLHNYGSKRESEQNLQT